MNTGTGYTAIQRSRLYGVLQNSFTAISIMVILGIFVGVYVSREEYSGVWLVFPIALFVIWRYPLVGLVLYLIVAQSFFRIPWLLPTIPIFGQRGLLLEDIIVLTTTGLVLARNGLFGIMRSGRTTALVLILLFYLVLSGFGIMIFNDYDFAHTLSYLRIYAASAIFFFIVGYANTEAQLRQVVELLLTFALIASVLFSLLIVLGVDRFVDVPLLGLSTWPITSFQELPAMRLFVPGFFFSAAMLPVALALWLESDNSRHRRWFLAATTLIILVAVIINFTRSVWLSEIVAVVLVVLGCRRRLWKQMVPMVMVGAVGCALAVYGLHFVPALQGVDIFAVLWESFASPLENGMEDSSVIGRLIRIEDALVVWQESPFLGMGPIGWRSYTDHNMYVDVLQTSGMIGLALYALVVASFLARCWYALRVLRSHTFCQALVVGIAASFMRFPIFGLVSSSPIFGYERMWPFLMLGLVEAITRVHAASDDGRAEVIQ